MRRFAPASRAQEQQRSQSMVDLHTHSTASDGTLSPEALVDLAAEKGLTALALTDHDTMAGVPPALARGAACGVHVVPGVELGVEWEGAGTMHILGYFVRYGDPRLEESLAGLRAERRERARRMVARLNELGCVVSFEQVEQIGSGEAIGRPHVARALLESGAVKSLAQAFERYLKRGRPAFVEKEELSPAEGISLLKSSGGIAILAHPATLRLGKKTLARCVEELKEQGLDGLEAFWSGHNAAQVESYTALARRLGLLITGGSDFHGENKPGVELGSGRRGNVQVPDSVLEALRRHGGATVPREAD